MQGAGELQRQVEAHKARQARLGITNKPAPCYRQREFVDIVAIPFKPEPSDVYWRSLWCGDLVFRLPLPGTTVAYVPTIKRIQEVVCRYFDIQVADLVGRRRDAAIVEARDIALHLCRREGARTSTEIGRRFDRDHSSVLTAIKRAGHKFKFDPTFAAHYNAVRVRL